MEVYSQPLGRVVFGQNKLWSMNSSQRAMYFKYATIIKNFLIGTTADVLRMRLNQVADTSLMSLKSFLSYHKINIILALSHSRSSLILVFPPSDISPDLSTWNTSLLCLVLRASNCLNIREQDDVIYLSKIYKRYFNSNQQEPGCGTITRRGYIAKREWFKTCAAVQRLVEIVDDPELIKAVRKFICKVEMEGKAPKARKDAQLRLESFVSELISGDAISKNRNKNLTDEAKQIEKGQFKMRKAPKLKQKLLRRPTSAGARLNMEKERDEHVGLGYRKHTNRSSRPTSATRSEKSQSSRRSSGNDSQRIDFHSDKKTIMKIKVDNGKADNSKLPDACRLELQNQRTIARKRPSSAVERTPSKASFNSGIIRRSSISLGQSSTYKTDRKYVSGSYIALSRDGLKRSRPNSARNKRQSKTVPNEDKLVNKLDRKKENATKQGVEHELEGEVKKLPDKRNKLEKDSKEIYSYASKNKRESEIKRENSMILKGLRPSSGRRQKSRSSKKKSKEDVDIKTKEDIKDAIICVPTAEPELADINDADKEREDNAKDDTQKNDQDNTNQTEGTHGDNVTEKTTGCLERFSLKEKPKLEDQIRDEKRKVFDENMKKIANEVLVHQKIHEAVQNPLLQDKEFVDEFFAFLNENHVTKKFLRAQSIEPRESWNLPGGKHANLSFFVAFVFRHIHTKDAKMVAYIVEKMLLRMRCKHALEQKVGENNVERKHGRSETEEFILSPEHEDRRKAYKEASSSMDYEQLYTSRSRSASRDRRSSTPRSKKRSRSSSKRGELPVCADDNPKVIRSTCITDNLCWKCTQKELALTACVNWSNRYLCDLLVSEGVSYKEEHLSAAVKANDLISLVKIVDFLKSRGIWDSSSKEAKDALFLARKLRMRLMVDFLTEESVQDDRIDNKNMCTPCFIA